MKNFKALALFSGGLDSMIAVKLIKEQGVDVTALFIDTGFGSTKENIELVKKRALECGADFEAVNIRENFIQEILFSPKYGYGKNFNPCIDCHANMIRVAKALLPKYGADFIITGEVIAQRPMSQRKDALMQVKKLSGTDEENILLRPLSAKLLEPTKPEIEGWVDREKLLDISGRNRETQLKLAKKYGFEDYDTPAGGCLLTDQKFSQRLREFIKFDKLEASDVDLLKIGRHLRLPNGAKLIVGRNHEENQKIKEFINEKMSLVRAEGVPSPTSCIDKNASKEDRELAAKIILTFTKAKPDETYRVIFEDETIEASPFKSREEAHKYFV
ncbi:MAG: ATP-binding protein [Epsilonproteobacteria bacterium]|nr:ATP-binding protein [Campylobacterota bacterium]